MQDEDGNYIVKPAPAPQPQQPAGGSSHKHNYTWQHSDDEHWQYCADCGQAISNGPHTLQWKDGYQECTVCGYRVGSSTAAAPAAQASAPAAAAPAANTAAAAPAAGTATTAAATSIPQTGDESNPLLWVVLLAVSGSALGALVYTKKKVSKFPLCCRLSKSLKPSPPADMRRRRRHIQGNFAANCVRGALRRVRDLPRNFVEGGSKGGNRRVRHRRSPA